MARLVVLYDKPADGAAFDAYYFGTHVPIAKKIPGLLSYDVSDGGVAGPSGASPFHLAATLEFESVDALQRAMASAEGRAAAADVANFAQAGVQMLIFDTKDV